MLNRNRLGNGSRELKDLIAAVDAGLSAEKVAQCSVAAEGS